MIRPEHPDTERLRQLLRGRLEDEDAGGLLAHLESCGHCQDLAEKIWAEESPLAEELEPPRLDAATGERLEQGLFQRVHRTRLLENATVFGSRGFLFVLLEFLRPFLDLFSRTDNDRRSS